MESVCLVLDLQGFQLSPKSGGEFLLREFGRCRRKLTLRGHAHIDHRRTWRRLSKFDKSNIAQFRPSPVEGNLPACTIIEYVRDLNQKYKTEALTSVAYWDNEQIKLLLNRLNIQGIDLNLYHCPDFETLIFERADGSRLTCRRHSHLDPAFIGKCAEETAYNFAEWLERNVAHVFQAT